MRLKKTWSNSGFAYKSDDIWLDWNALNWILVYLFIGEHVALVDFVKALHELGALANGEYIIISIDDFDYDPNSNAQQYTSRSKLNTFHWIPFYLQIREKKNSDLIVQWSIIVTHAYFFTNNAINLQIDTQVNKHWNCGKIFTRFIDIFFQFKIFVIADYLDPYVPTLKASHQFQAFHSVLKVTPSYPRNPEFQYVEKQYCFFQN